MKENKYVKDFGRLKEIKERPYYKFSVILYRAMQIEYVVKTPCRVDIRKEGI